MGEEDDVTIGTFDISTFALLTFVCCLYRSPARLQARHRSLAELAAAVDVNEFVALYESACNVPRLLDLQELQQTLSRWLQQEEASDDVSMLLRLHSAIGGALGVLPSGQESTSLRTLLSAHLSQLLQHSRSYVRTHTVRATSRHLYPSGERPVALPSDAVPRAVGGRREEGGEQRVDVAVGAASDSAQPGRRRRRSASAAERLGGGTTSSSSCCCC